MGARILAVDDTAYSMQLMTYLPVPVIAVAESTRGCRNGCCPTCAPCPPSPPVPFAFLGATADWQDPILDVGKTLLIRRPVEPGASSTKSKPCWTTERGH